MLAFLSLGENVKRSDIQKKTATYPVKIISFEVAAVKTLLNLGI